ARGDPGSLESSRRAPRRRGWIAPGQQRGLPLRPAGAVQPH
ncbi:hypothetical protein BCSJ1_25893, partial [Bacillus cereus SJ1]